MPVPLRILILEDTKSDMELVLHELKRAGFDAQYKHAQNEAEYVSYLEPDLDVILADFNLPQFDALRALRILQDRGLHIPFLVATSSISEEAAVLCMKNGATDYLLKDRLARLGPAIRQALEARKEHEAKLQAEEQIRRRNRELTLLNRVIAACTTSDEENVFLQVSCRELAQTLGVPHVVAIRFDDGASTAVVAAESCSDAAHSVLHASFRLADGPAKDLPLRGKEPFVADRPEAELSLPPLRGHLSSRGIASIAYLPILVDDQPAGGLGLAAAEGGFFTEERIALVRSVADQLSNALVRARLERDHRRLITVIEQISDAVILTDRDRVIRYVNPGFERMSGYAGAEVLGRPARILASGSPEADLDQTILQMADSGREWRGRLVNRRKDGQVYTVDTTLSPIFDKSGSVVSFAAVQRDITEGLQLEQRYRQSQKMEAVGRLAGGVAHDFNNLLTAILGYADMLVERITPDNPGRGDLDEIRRAGERASGLTRQLLAFSRKQVMQNLVVNLNDIVGGMERMLRPLIGETIELRTELEPALWPVKTDPGQIEQVVMNLAINARDAMPHGGRILVATGNAELDESYALRHPDGLAGAFVRLTVSDTGTGIDENVLPHLFEPFFTTKEEGKGTGLGLATVYGIVKQSGGHIGVSSETGRGTVFEVYLPRYLGNAGPAEGSEDHRAASRGTEAILLVEDDPMVRDLARRVLQNHGYQVSTEENPEEALRKAAESGGQIDMLVTDIVMPGMDGRQLAERIQESHPGLKVLFISGYSETDMPVADAQMLKAGFLQKPFSPRALIRTVREVLDG